MSPKESIKNDRVVELIKGGVESLGVRGLARNVGISPAIVTRYMQGKVGEPSQSTLEKLAVYYGVTVAWLRGGTIGPLERLLEGLKIGGIDPVTFNKTMADEIGREVDSWRALVSGKVNDDWAGIMCHLFGINDHWLKTGEHPTLLTRGGIVGTIKVGPGSLVAGFGRAGNNLSNFATRKDPRAGGDSPPSAEDIANWLRKNPELRKMVEELLAAEEQPGSQND